MKVLLISANRERGFRPALPLGMITIAGELIKHNHELLCIDLCFEDSPTITVEKAMQDFNPDVVGISIRNIDNQNFLEPIFNLPFIRRLNLHCRELSPSCKIVLGGPGFTLMPEEIMRYTYADFGIIGPGEKNFPILLERLTKNENINDIPGLIYFRKGSNVLLINKPNEFSTDFGSTFPARELYDNRYFSSTYRNPIFTEEIADSVLSKRGCILSCIYCTNSVIAGTKIRLKSPGTTVDEIEQIIKHGRAKKFEFADGAFNMPYDHALQVCREMVKRKIHYPWICMFSPGTVTQDLVDLMAETGCCRVELGTEAGSNKILKNLEKNFGVEQIRKTHQILTERGIRVEHCIFIGSPGENRDTVLETFELMNELVPNSKNSLSRVFISLGFRVFKETKLYQIALEEGVLRKEDCLALPRFYVSPNVLRDDLLLSLIEKWVVEHQNWYLWWGLPHYSLRERIEEVNQVYKKIEDVYYETMNSINM